MKKIMFFVLGVMSIAVITGCQKKEVAEAPVQQPMVSEQVAAVAPVAPAAVSTEPVGVTMPDATAVVDETASAVTQAASLAVDQLVNTGEKPTTQQIQQALKNLGLYDGKVDGSLGPKTKKAIEAFQAQNGLTPDGKVGPRTWAKLVGHIGSAAATVSTEPIMPEDASATATTTTGAAN